jgi:hypothetical protein
VEIQSLDDFNEDRSEMEKSSSDIDDDDEALMSKTKRKEEDRGGMKHGEKGKSRRKGKQKKKERRKWSVEQDNTLIFKIPELESAQDKAGALIIKKYSSNLQILVSSSVARLYGWRHRTKVVVRLVSDLHSPGLHITQGVCGTR